jgi:tetratricopeptide (TPR) repeat protein
MSRGLWGGTIRPGGTGSFDFTPDPAPLRTAREALETAVTLRPNDARWRAALGEAYAAAGDLDGAVAAYEKAVRAAERTTQRWALGTKQRWQFQLELCHARNGTARVVDPLFQVTAIPAGKQVTGDHQVPGLFTAQLGYAGLTISGFLLTPAAAEYVTVMLGESVLRSVNVNDDSHLPLFTLLIKRSALARFPQASTLRVVTPEGEPLRAPHGFAHIELAIPHGDGSVAGILGAGGSLTKKGEIAQSLVEVRQRQDRDLEIYRRVRDFFEDHLGRSIFLLYGSLLGYHRDGDLIPGDDDFDAGFVCDATDAVGAKQETKDIVVALISAGFTVSFNRRGRLFRIQLNRAGRDHVDVHPVWFQDGNAWIHNVARLPLTRDQFLPAATGKLRGVTVSTPHDPEAFLQENYGKGWKVPDPGFRYYPGALAPQVRRNLARALITVGEYHDLARRVERETAGSATAGRLVSIGSQDLYPLEQFIA